MMPEDMEGLLFGVNVGSRWPDIKTHAVYFLCPELQNDLLTCSIWRIAQPNQKEKL